MELDLWGHSVALLLYIEPASGGWKKLGNGGRGRVTTFLSSLWAGCICFLSFPITFLATPARCQHW